MPKQFLEYIKILNPGDWQKMATPKWTVKDVVAHLLGWEKGDPKAIRKAWETKTPPRWEKTNEYDDEFNRKTIEEYQDASPQQLIDELSHWQAKTNEEIDRIGEDNLKRYPKIFRWLFEGPGGTRGNKHYSHHLKQIRQALGR